MTNIALPRRYTLPAWGLTLIVALVAELVYFSLTTRQFAGHGTGMLVLTEQFVPIGILALGAGMVILTGNIDLSAGATASLSAIVVGTELRHGVGMWGAIGIAVAAGVGFGLFNGLVVALLGIDSLLVTLATQFIATSLATSIGGESPPYGFSDMFQRIGTGLVGPIPSALLLFLVLAAITVILVSRTGFGRALTLIGYSRSAADYSGIRTRRTLVIAFTLSGLFSGIAGLVLAAYYNSARDDIGTTLLLPAITCVVLGGVDIFGGKGRIAEVVVAVFFLGFLSQGLLMSGRSSLTVTMITGILLIVALVVKLSLERQSGESLGGALRRLLSQRGFRRPARQR
ncbi:ABC transporter permease [Rugosimonospora africana]|uniref:Autoinducer 2 import system permease protein LsrD n=1 Tax=Rugosimonospora africana TaxID=556532 RepID=A0A8J3VT43_9ACTN|nr:ABC transporter permease [Rugosimonospora africana]GIH18027.1 ribose ABC transporter permease [Rugosimonospora africana]